MGDKGRENEKNEWDGFIIYIREWPKKEYDICTLTDLFLFSFDEGRRQITSHIHGVARSCIMLGYLSYSIFDKCKKRTTKYNQRGSIRDGKYKPKRRGEEKEKI